MQHRFTQCPIAWLFPCISRHNNIKKVECLEKIQEQAAPPLAVTFKI